MWLAFLPRVQEVKIAYVSPEAEKFDEDSCYVCHFIQQSTKTVQKQEKLLCSTPVQNQFSLTIPSFDVVCN